MAYNHSISVKVCGNPESSGGFGPILLLNNPSFVVEDQFYVGFDKNSFFFTITTYQTQTVYKLVKNNVRSSGAFRVGSLVIAISIPKNYKLEGGYTPYDVLCALKDEFLKKCMTCKDPVRETYEYTAGKIDGHVLDEVVSKFTLTDSRAPYRVMTPNGPVGYIEETEEKIKEFFQDVNYPEFVKFKEVVVATTVHTTSYVPISNIQIPRPKKYEVIVDGERMGFYSNLNEKIPVKCHSKSPDYYDNLSWEFSIQDLIDDNESHEGVVLDTGQERVIVNTKLWGTPKEKKVFLAISPKECEDYFIRNPWELEVTLLSSNPPKTIVISKERLVIALQGKEIAALKDDGIQVATTDQCIYKVKKCQLVEEDELHVEVAQRKRPSPVPAGNLTVNVTFPEDKDLRGIRSVDLQAKNCIDHKVVLPQKRVRLDRVAHPKSHKGSFTIMAKYIPPFDFYLTCSIKNEVWKTDEIKPNQKSVEATFFKIHRPFTERYRKPLVCVLVTMMALVLGGLSFVLYNKSEKQEIAQQEGFTEDKIDSFLHDVDRSLKTNDLKFVTVDNLYDKYSNNKTAIDKHSQSKKTNREICQRLYEYKKVIDFIRTGKVDSIKEIVNDNRKYELFHTHRACLEQIVKDETIFATIVTNHKHLNSFVEITELLENYVNPIDSTCNYGATDEDNRITDPLDEEENKARPKKTMKKQEAVLNPSESKQSKNAVSEKEKTKFSGRKKGIKHKYTCVQCGVDTWFHTKKELDNHIKALHTELND